MHNILIIGAETIIGNALKERFGDLAVAITADDLNLASPDFEDDCKALLEKYTPSIVLNGGGYDDVENAEFDGRNDAFLMNADAPFMMAKLCKTMGILFVHFSSEHVFSGRGTAPWREDDPTDPVNVYGMSKCAGEELVQSFGGHYLIIRSSWVYDTTHESFFTSMIEMAKQCETLTVAHDQMGAPTYAPDLAKSSAKLIEKALLKKTFPAGAYHLCNSGKVSRFDYVRLIVDIAEKEGLPIKASDIRAISTGKSKNKAQRPLNSRLDCGKVHMLFGIEMPHLRESLTKAIKVYAAQRKTENA